MPVYLHRIPDRTQTRQYLFYRVHVYQQCQETPFKAHAYRCRRRNRKRFIIIFWHKHLFQKGSFVCFLVVAIKPVKLHIKTPHYYFSGWGLPVSKGRVMRKCDLCQDINMRSMFHTISYYQNDYYKHCLQHNEKKNTCNQCSTDLMVAV